MAMLFSLLIKWPVAGRKIHVLCIFVPNTVTLLHYITY